MLTLKPFTNQKIRPTEISTLNTMYVFLKSDIFQLKKKVISNLKRSHKCRSCFLNLIRNDTETTISIRICDVYKERIREVQLRKWGENRALTSADFSAGCTTKKNTR